MECRSFRLNVSFLSTDAFGLQELCGSQGGAQELVAVAGDKGTLYRVGGLRWRVNRPLF